MDWFNSRLSYHRDLPCDESLYSFDDTNADYDNYVLKETSIYSYWWFGRNPWTVVTPRFVEGNMG